MPSEATLSIGKSRSYACLADAPCELDATIERQLARNLPKSVVAMREAPLARTRLSTSRSTYSAS